MTTNASALVTIENRLGLHARPAMLFAETAMKFASDISVKRRDQDSQVDGKSIMQLMMLAAIRGTELELTANGEDANQAINQLSELVHNRFNEDTVEGV